MAITTNELETYTEKYRPYYFKDIIDVNGQGHLLEGYNYIKCLYISIESIYYA